MAPRPLKRDAFPIIACVPSKDLGQALLNAERINTFNSIEAAHNWYKRLPPYLHWEIVNIGITKCLSSISRFGGESTTYNPNRMHTVRAHDRKSSLERMRTVKQKAQVFDRMVEALDAVTVGDKLLGDCTGADLLREAVRLESEAKEMTAQATFYRQLAAIVGKTTTVRSYNDRGQIVGLITARYKEEV